MSSVLAALSRHCQRPLSAAHLTREPQVWALQNIRAWTNDSNKKGPKKNSHSSPQKKKHASIGNAPAAAGRVVVHQASSFGSNKSKSGAKLCSGCGTQVISGGGRGSTKMTGGTAAAAAAEEQRTKKQVKQGRYFDVSDLVTSKSSRMLCDRCKALQGDNMWQAYDALRDVEPKVFMDQLKFVVQRRRYGLCVAVLDATDSEHSVVRNLRSAIGKLPLLVVWNKVDLMPRFSPYDQKALESKVRKKLPFIQSFSVSAKTGHGLVDLAEYLLENLGGRDVFVVGAANVGKSTMVKKISELIAQSVYLKGKGKKVERRREQASSLQVTGSHLPGTTLQAVRIPCFSSNRHALWDTPGIINSRALQYHLFPAHLMLPLTRPERIEVPTDDNGLVHSLKPGYSLLIESTWMGGNGDRNEVGDDYDGDENTSATTNNNNNQEECVLARIDLVDIGKSDRNVLTKAYLHPSLRIRVVPTSLAPESATIPLHQIRRVQKNIREATGQKETGLADEYSIPLKAFTSPDRPRGEFEPSESDRGTNTDQYYMDIVFASLGWIGFSVKSQFSIIPHCVQGSVFSKRRSLYPTNLSPDDAMTEHDYVSSGEGELYNSKERIRTASDSGRHGRQKRSSGNHGGGHDDDFDDDLYWS